LLPRASLEIADIFRNFGPAWRRANAGHVSLGQLKVMSAIERCRTAAPGGHVARCENAGCGHTIVAYNSCRNRHCPKCQGAAAREWLEEREAELLPVPYFHVVYTLPAPIAAIAYQNEAALYGILFKASAEATIKIAADPKRLGARIGITSVLHTRALRRSGARFAARSARSLKAGSAFPTRSSGLGYDPSPACAYDRARRRPLRRWQALDRLQVQIPFAGPRFVAAVPASCP